MLPLITDRFDCDVMRDIYDAIEAEYDYSLTNLEDTTSSTNAALPVSKVV